MECTQTQTRELTNEEFMRQFNKNAAQHRVPISGNLALTHRCSVRCLHCYLGEEVGAWENISKELETAQWKTIIDDITEAGCLYLLITGGEPLLRKDFKEIYRQVKTNGLVVTVFTNATLINEGILELFLELPPKVVEVSIYGASAETHEKITGVKGSYEKCLKGIRRLIDGQINVRLKTILMTLNRHELFDMENMARGLGVKFRFDAAVFPALNGNKTPIKLRVPAEDAVKMEFSDDDRLQQWKDFFERMPKLPVSDSLYQCGAGVTHFHIDPFGNLQPCLMITDLKYNLVNGTFSAGWNEVMPRLRERKPATGYRCNQCQKRAFCGFCPAFFKLENDKEATYSEFLCTMGHLRFEKINKILYNDTSV
ncbi:MAG: radical SAM protein [Candidatus Aminicenantes bacterium]|nr:MAG: radical SAM protein [Candidatus Aminicenantes bacterium]